jgi:hypothetical protein
VNEVYLHPLTVGELLDKAFRLYRARFTALIGIAAAVLIPEGIVRLLAILYLGTTGGSLVTSVMQGFIRLISNIALAVFIAHAYLGKPISFNESFSLGLKRYWSVWGANFLVGLAIGLPVGIVAACGMLTLGIGTVAIFLAIPLVFFLSTRWSLSMPAILLENMDASSGLKRSWDLTEKFFWRVLGTSFAAGLLTTLITLIPTYFSQYLFGLTDIDSDTVQIINLAVEQLALLIALPFAQAVTVLMYYDLRVRKEGFDLQVLAESSNAPIVSPEG